ncbi:MAG: hypothetical protein P1V35_05220 [Planctomycetota bacterium]|nr:hypothetical protein [Planctomycetota bacterium]
MHDQGNETKPIHTYLRNGSGAGPYEDWIIGDADGLRKLRDACDIAIEHGESSETNLDDFSGVVLLEPGWDAEDPEGTTSTIMISGCVALVLALFGIFIIGVRQVIHWAFG